MVQNTVTTTGLITSSTQSKQQAKLLSVATAAEITGLSRITVYRNIENGTWPSIKIGSRRLISSDWIDGLIAKAGGQ